METAAAQGRHSVWSTRSVRSARSAAEACGRMSGLCFCTSPLSSTLTRQAGFVGVLPVTSRRNSSRVQPRARPERRAFVVASEQKLKLPPKLSRLVDSFAVVPDAKMRYQQLLFFAKKLPGMDPSLKTDENLVRGCTSVVHVDVRLDEEKRVQLAADSDSQLTKGMIALLVNGLNGCTPKEVLEFDPAFLVASGLSVSLTPSRNNGFLNMIAKVKARVTELSEGTQDESPAKSEGEPRVDGPPVYSAIVSKLNALRPAELAVVDDSAKHAGHAGARGHGPESHFTVRVVSDAFEELSTVKRHRMIYALLSEEMKKVHALSITALTNEEALSRAQ